MVLSCQHTRYMYVAVAPFELFGAMTPNFADIFDITQKLKIELLFFDHKHFQNLLVSIVLFLPNK